MILASDEYFMIEFLYNINDLKNLISIFEHGLLSKNDMRKQGITNFVDLSNSKVQQRRSEKKVINHGYLHDYASLYFDARNPMMYYEITNNNMNELCVICVDKKVLDLEGTVVSDRNAAAEFAYIDTPHKVLRQLDFEAVKARYWNDDNYTVYTEKKAKKCAEVLVLNKIPIKYLIKIKVATALAKENAERLHLSIPIEVDKDMFFQ